MQKRIFPILWLIFGLGFPPFAHAAPDAYIFFQPISGTGSSAEDKANITKMLINEITARNCVLLDTPHGTDFILFGALAPYYAGYEDLYLMNTPPASTIYSYNTSLQDAPDAWGQLYVFHLILRNTETNENLIQQSVLYYSIDDIYNFFPLLMFNLFAFVLDYTPGLMQDVQVIAEDSGPWRDKWLYFRTSMEFPITFYTLNDKNLIQGVGVYAGNFDKPDRVAHVDNKTVAMPALTFGVEFQFLNWMSIEPKVQANWEHINDTDFFGVTPGVELKFPIKFNGVMLEPYAAATYPIPLLVEDLFKTFPIIGAGGGIQLGVKGSKSIAIFIDINYMYYIGDVGMINPYGNLYPKPEVINFQRSVIGLGVGLKAGFIDRQKKTVKDIIKETKEQQK